LKRRGLVHTKGGLVSREKGLRFKEKQKRVLGGEEKGFW